MDKALRLSGIIRHRLIVIEGMDGTGKTTVARQLADVLRACYFRTPSQEFESSRLFVDTVGSVETRFLYYLCSVSCASDLIRNELAERDVVCDRYLDSTIAYHRALGLRVKWGMDDLNLVKPSHSFLLEVSDESERLRRLEQRGFLTAGDRLLENQETREAIAFEYRKFDYIRIDTTARTPSAVVDLIIRHLEAAAHNRASQEFCE